MTWTREELERRSDDQIAEISSRVANRVTKWRATFASWQLGTRAKSDGEVQAVRDQRELLILLRAEVNALTALLIEAGVITSRTLTIQEIQELEHLDKSFERRFPGFSSTDDGMVMELPDAARTMQGWPP